MHFSAIFVKLLTHISLIFNKFSIFLVSFHPFFQHFFCDFWLIFFTSYPCLTQIFLQQFLVNFHKFSKIISWFLKFVYFYGANSVYNMYIKRGVGGGELLKTNLFLVFLYWRTDSLTISASTLLFNSCFQILFPNIILFE